MVEIRFINDDEVVEFRNARSLGFGDDLPDDPHGLERHRALSPLETTIAAFDRGRIVATFSSYDLELTVPGGTLATAGTTQVTVHPTHRRRGILSEMMTMHLHQAVERNQPMAALWASEEVIYGRYGYGPACFSYDLRTTDRTVELGPPDPEISLHTITDAEAGTMIPPIYDRVLPTVPGFLARSEPWWNERSFRDPEHWRGGASAQRFVIAERAAPAPSDAKQSGDGVGAEAVGYVIYRQRRGRGDAENAVEIVELVSVDDDARRALWHFITNVDLYHNVRWWNAPVDEPLLVEAERFRAIGTTLQDTMWLRPLDIPRVLEARTYERDGTLVMDVADPYLGRGGRFRLEVESGKGRCSETGDSADVELSVSELGSVYLGGRSAEALARARRIQGEQTALDTMTDLFHTRRPPFCIEMF